MFTVSIETNFRAEHQLNLSGEQKEQLHEHDWLVTAEVSREALNNIGLVIDFNLLKEMVDEIVAEFKGGTLEKFDYFQKYNASAEMIAKYIYEKLENKLPKNVKLENITVVEQSGCSAKFGKPR